MKKVCLIVLALCFVASSSWAAKVKINGVNEGQFHTINILGAENSSIDGGTLTLDTRDVTQSSATGAVAALTIDQDDVDQPALAFECTEGSDDTNTCSHYATTGATKAGTIKISINGTTRFINFYATPD